MLYGDSFMPLPVRQAPPTIQMNPLSLSLDSFTTRGTFSNVENQPESQSSLGPPHVIQMYL